MLNYERQIEKLKLDHQAELSMIRKEASTTILDL